VALLPGHVMNLSRDAREARKDNLFASLWSGL
jgi:hypothetical protein